METAKKTLVVVGVIAFLLLLAFLAPSFFHGFAQGFRQGG